MTVVRYTSDSLQGEKKSTKTDLSSQASRETVDKSGDLPGVSAGGVFPPRVRQGGRKQQSVAKARQRPAVFVQSDPNARWRH